MRPHRHPGWCSTTASAQLSPTAPTPFNTLPPRLAQSAVVVLNHKPVELEKQ